jgi:hypothetical protein
LAGAFERRGVNSYLLSENLNFDFSTIHLRFKRPMVVAESVSSGSVNSSQF